MNMSRKSRSFICKEPLFLLRFFVLFFMVGLCLCIVSKSYSKNSECNLSDAIALYYGFKYEQAFICFTSESLSEIPASNLYLGMMYFFGQGVEKNTSKAIFYYKRAAESGDPRAEYLLGSYYLHDFDKVDSALRLLEKSAATNEPFALHKLGELYFKGDLVKKDACKAIEYLTKASSLGHAKSDVYLGLSFMSGECVNIDYAKAYMHFNRAAEAGLPIAHYYIAVMYENGMHVERDCFNALKYYNKAAAKGFTMAEEKVNSLTKSCR